MKGWLVLLAIAALNLSLRSAQDPIPGGRPIPLDPGGEIQKSEGRLLLIPLDDRPASTQFAQMIAQIDQVEVALPPTQLLGSFTKQGDPEGILEWLQQEDLNRFTAVIVSTDMLCYGGLIASRTSDSDYALAILRLRSLQKLRRRYPHVKFYAFSAIMRLAPTATRASAAWRIQLARYAETKERYRRTPTPQLLASLRNLQAKIPPLEIQRYEDTRARNHKVQQELVRMVSANVFDYLILGQDDAQPFGPHVPESDRLKQMVSNLKVRTKVYFCEGIDQHANVLVSRALLTEANWVPRVRIVYADDLGKRKIANYESNPVEESLMDQLIASGARYAGPEDPFDYSLYINTPEPRPEQFQQFLQNLKTEIDQSFPVAVADINLGKTGTGDPVLFDALAEGGRSTRLLSYAGWNTAGNTMGTAIPAANIYLLARRMQSNPFEREMAQRAFLLHRLVDDFAYHRFTRPQAYAMIDANPRASREETYGDDMDQLNAFVNEDLTRRLEDTFKEQFLGKRFFAGTKQYVFTAVDHATARLPWPRAYEVRLDFRLEAQEVDSSK